jgi:hypothetical protein
MGQLPESCHRENAAVASWDQDEDVAALYSRSTLSFSAVLAA